MEDQELQVEPGVETGDSQESAPSTAEATTTRQPEPERKINLDDSLEFRRWKAEYDRRLGETERRYQAMLAQREQELERSRVAEMDDYQRLEYQLEQERQRAAAAYQQLQEYEVERAKMRVLSEVSAETGVPVDALAEAQDVADAWRLAAIKRKELDAQREQEVRKQAAQQAEQRLQKQAANRVDVGSGTPIPANDWERQYQTLKQQRNSRALFEHALKQQG